MFLEAPIEFGPFILLPLKGMGGYGCLMWGDQDRRRTMRYAVNIGLRVRNRSEIHFERTFLSHFCCLTNLLYTLMP